MGIWDYHHHRFSLMVFWEFSPPQVFIYGHLILSLPSIWYLLAFEIFITIDLMLVDLAFEIITTIDYHLWESKSITTIDLMSMSILGYHHHRFLFMVLWEFPPPYIWCLWGLWDYHHIDYHLWELESINTIDWYLWAF